MWIAVRSCVLLALTACTGFGLKPAPDRVAVKDVPEEAREASLSPRKRLLVLPFVDVEINRSKEVALSARHAVVNAVTDTRQFLVVRNDDVPGDVHRFYKNQEYDLEEVAKVAQGMGVAAVVEGKILEVKARRLGDQVGFFKKVNAQVEASVRIRVFATKTGREILQDIRTAQIESSTTQIGDRSAGQNSALEEDPKLISEVTEKAFSGTIGHIIRALDKLEWEGRIALVKGDRLYLNAGRLSGLQVGDILKVLEEGEEVYDPETGSLIGRVPGRMKGTVEIVSYFGKDGAVAIVHSGAGFAENDRVELY